MIYNQITFAWYDSESSRRIKCLEKRFYDCNPMNKKYTSLYEFLTHLKLVDQIYIWREKGIEWTFVELYLDNNDHCRIYQRLESEFPGEFISGDEEDWLMEVCD